MKTISSILLLQGAALLLAAKAAADLGLDNDHVPTACRDICQPIVRLTSLCDLDDNGGDDEAEKQCICTNDSFNVAQVGGLCQSCIEQNDDRINGKSPKPPIDGERQPAG